jgi:cold shock CspA family protein
MRGEVLHYDDEQGFGFINGADGKRYAFERSDLRRLVPVSKGTVVEFQIDGATARELFIIRSDMRASAPAQFGRDAVAAEPESTGLWSYFVRTLTSNYANFRGRARRKEYWGYVLFLTILLIVVIGIGIALDNRTGSLVGEEIPTATLPLAACSSWRP